MTWEKTTNKVCGEVLYFFATIKRVMINEEINTINARVFI
jgi:hypothetical protein